MAESLFMSHEEEYQVAGWLGTLRIMRDVGEQIVIQSNLSTQNIGKFAIEVCSSLYQKPNETPVIIQKWIDSPSRKNKERRDNLAMLGVLNNQGNLASEFNDALQLNADDPFAHHVLEATPFSRLTPTIDELYTHFQPAVFEVFDRGISLTPRLKEAQHDIAFYVGQYDPAKNS